MPNHPNRPALRAFFDNQVSFMTELTRQSCASLRQLSEVHLQLSQHLLEDGFNAGRQLLACTDPLQLSSAAVGQLQPVSQHLHAYQQQLMKVMAGVQVDLTRTAENMMPEAGRSARAAAEELARRTAQAAQAFALAGRGDGAAMASNPASANGAHRAVH